MRWEDLGRSRNLEDRRGSRGRGRGVAIGGSLGLGGVLLVLVLSLVTGVDLFSVLGPATGPTVNAPAPQAAAPIEDPAEEELVRFASFVLDHSQETWRDIFRASGLEYRDARLVLYRDAVSSACGRAPAAVGPFYCPLDEKVYIDLGFFDTLRTRLRAPGDFAPAYVMAHEIGHHVQNLLGTADDVRAAQQSNPAQANELSVAQELQADCFAGVWGSSIAAEGRMEQGDLEEGMRAAAAVGDDRLQGRGGADVRPETFTHGSSEQRTQWFRTGFDSGDPNACRTFAGL